MMKLSRLLLHSSRDSLSSKSMVGVAANHFKLLSGTGCERGMSSTATPTFERGGRIFAPYKVYKGKAALSAEPVLPEYAKLESGDYRIERKGGIMLTFSPAIGERKYDWEKKQLFALSATEVGSLLSLGPKDSCEFFHDPAMKTSNAGQVRKNLAIKAHADGSGYLVSLTVANNITQTNDRFVVPVTAAEFAVMRTAFSFALPHIMGWNQTVTKLPLRSDQVSAPLGTRLFTAPVSKPQTSEWDR